MKVKCKACNVIIDDSEIGDKGELPGGDFFSQANGISADGSTVVGRSESDTALNLEAFRWTEASGMIGLGKLSLPGDRLSSRASATSSNGSVVVGGSATTMVGEAFLWTQATGLVALGDLSGGSANSQAQGVSPDGRIVVGLGNSGGGSEAFRWESATGMEGLGDLPGGDSDSYADGVSADSRVIVGVGSSDAGREAFRWTAPDGMVGLGDLPGGNYESGARDVSADGRVVVGYGSISFAEPFSAPFLWDETNGMQNLEDLLMAQGVDLAGWQLREASGVSADGSIIVGTGRNPDGFQEAWIADLNPIPSNRAFAAVLPGSRSVRVGEPATAFATIMNTASVTAIGCSITFLYSVPADIFYQTTDPVTNAPTGTPSTPTDIIAGGLQTFVFAITPSAAFTPTDLPLIFDCSNSAPVWVLPGINTLLLSASNTPVPDIIVISVTPTNDGIISLPGTFGNNAFATASVNVGSSADITVTADTGDAALPVTLSICETTNSSTGSCLSPPSDSVTTTITTGATPTFAIFVAGNGNVPLNPANNRIYVRFKDASGVTRGSTSVAVQTL